MVRNFKMIVSYDGTRYFGWEHQQETDLTIQGRLETVLTRMVERDPDQPVTVIGAGRTDAGVHARAMTCNVLLDTEMDEEEIQIYMNRYLPEDISVNDVKVCADRFHSRFKARGKTYRYTCWYGNSKPVFDRRYVYVLDKAPDLEKMREAAEYLTGMHDYRSFCGNSKMKKSTVRVVDVIRIEESGSYIRFYFHGNGFLQHMVRIMVGTLLQVGLGEIEPGQMADIIEGKNRSLAGPTAPARGLCLMKVDY
ncbi:MAG: tRNA pseudouridine(38-40) synthase TruA [Lachnospiraceae bacterium]|nr:tRNA pseudouridine(38-40) synthase TruA [Lachnospiraceae bacterium]MDO4408195.1 tRNA pseudouridine(38-40) synthase TruA [Eubacteriales bacterium]